MALPRFVKNLIPPQRINMAILAFFGIVLNYAMRNCLAVAITVIAGPQPSNDTAEYEDSSSCPGSIEKYAPVTGFGQRYAWTQQQQGLILSAFYFAYWITHIPGAILAQKYGGKWVLSLGLLSTAIFTVITPLSIHWGGECSHISLFVTRFFMGLGEGTTFPAISTLLAAWIPDTERSTIGSFVYSGVQIGSVVTYLFSGVLLAHFEWDVVFYVWGFVSIVWFIIFTLVCFDDPASDPFIAQKETDYLEKKLGQLKRRTDLPPTPWRAIVTSVPVLVLICAQIGHDWGLLIMVSDLPKFMHEILGFAVRDVGIYASLPYLAMWIVSIASGFLCDFMIKREWTSPTWARKGFSFTGQIIPGVFMVAASYTNCNKALVVALFVLAMGSMGPYYAGVRVNPLDLSPNYAGSIMALKNGFASLCGGVAPAVVGTIIKNGTVDEWRIVFILAFVMLCVSILPYMIFASGEVQAWNQPNDQSKDKSGDEKTKR